MTKRKRINPPSPATFQSVEAIDLQPGAVVTIPIASVDVEDGFNARKTDIREKGSESIASLRAAIKREGQMSPILVRSKGKGKYRLIAGYRRLEACRTLGDTILATIASAVTKGKGQTAAQAIEIEDMYLNLSENLNREDLHPYDLSLRCHELSQKEQSGSAIAKRLGKSKAYVNALVRYQENLHSDILTAWRKGDKRCTTDELNVLQALKQDEQLERWSGKEIKFTGDEKDDKTNPGAKGPPVKTRRATEKQLSRALECVADAKIPDATKAGIRSALHFALGQTSRDSGDGKLVLYLPKVWDGVSQPEKPEE